MPDDDESDSDNSYLADLDIDESDDEPEVPEAQPIEGVEGTQPLAQPIEGVEGTQPLAEPIEGVEGAQPLAEPIEGVEGAQPLAEPIEGVEGAQPLGVESIKDLPANFSFETYDLKMFEGEYPDIYSPQVLEQRYNSEENEDKQKISLIKLNSATNKVFVGLNLYGKDLTGFNFDNKTFISCVFAYANLSKVNMRNAVLYDCNFQSITGNDINLSESLLYECNFFKADFINAVMKNLYCKYPNDEDYDRWPSIVDIMASERFILPEKDMFMVQFQKSILTNAIFDNSLLDEVEFVNTVLKKSSMRNCSLIKATFSSATLNEANFTNANCTSAHFDKADCTQVCFNNAKLKWIRGQNGNFTYCDFRSSNLERCNFTQATLNEANFTNADCSEGIFEEANCSQVCFNNTTSTSVNCESGNFVHCDFRRSNLVRSNFSKANLSYSIFQNCKANNIILTQAKLYKCFLDNVTMTYGMVNQAQLNGSIIINSSLESVWGSKVNCCDVFFKDSDLTRIDFGSSILFKTTFVNCTINKANLNGAFMIEELITNFRAIGVINDTWRAPTEPPPNEDEVCAIPTIEVPVYSIVAEETGSQEPGSSESFASSASSASSAASSIASQQPFNTISEFYWNPALETVAELLHPDDDNAAEIEIPFMNADGIRFRCPDERDDMVIRQIDKIYDYFVDLNNITLLEFMKDESVYRGPRTVPLSASLKFMNFKNCNFEGLNFSGLDLTGVNFFGCILSTANFSTCILKDTNFKWSDLYNVNFSNTNFEGDYAVGGLLEGATIMACNFEGTTFNGEDKSDLYNEFTTILPYSPKPYPEEATLMIEQPYDVINSNAKAIIKSDIEEIQETEAKISDFLAELPNNLAFRVIDYGNNYSDFLLEKKYVDKFLVNDNSVVYPCRKPFNIPGPSYPEANQTSYHDIERPFVNVGIMVGKRVWVQKDKFMDAYNAVNQHNISAPATKKGLAFFKDSNSEKVPTFVSKPVLFDNMSWVSALHCNSGAEIETLWYVKIVDVEEGEEVEMPSDAFEEFGEEGRRRSSSLSR